MSNVLDGNSRFSNRTPGRGVADGGGPPHDGDMEARLAKLEAVVPTLATKADLEKGIHDMVKWIVGTAFLGIALFITIMTFVLNNAVPKAAPAAQAAPIVIQIPTQPASPPVPDQQGKNP